MAYKDREKYLAMRKRSYEKHKEKRKADSRMRSKQRTSHQNYMYRIKSKYGLVPEDYESMLIRQDYRCAICHEDGKDLGVDHDHLTGEVRGLLCNSCNNGLGRFKDDTKILASAIRYLDRN